MSFRVVLYCPDRHLTYDGRTPEAVGVGGGVTARVRMARALARLGHEVTQVVNCPRREAIDGVEYVPLDEVGKIEADVAVFNTSGGALDLTPARDLDLSAQGRGARAASGARLVTALPPALPKWKARKRRIRPRSRPFDGSRR